jgi:DNA-binding transcriptional MerR regulator
MPAQSSRKRALETPVVPDRLYFKIGDVARICKVETYVLRFWETQFPQLKPNKSGTGQRLYRKHEVELALEIKRLVHGEGYTLSGAKQVLGQIRRGESAAASNGASKSGGSPRSEKLVATIGHARAELRELAGMLAAPSPVASRRKARMTSMPNATGALFPS